MEHIVLTYKTIIAQHAPFPTAKVGDFIKQLNAKKEALRSGEMGIYLARQVLWDGDFFYSPFLDIDGEHGLNGDAAISSAILNARLTMQSLKHLGGQEFFKVLATGGTGFRILSKHLFDRQTYLAFIKFVIAEMPHIHDLKPTEELVFPHQLFAYKGNKSQNMKVLVDRHSIEVPSGEILSGTMTPKQYRAMTSGKPDPGEIINFMSWLLNFERVYEVREMGPFGAKVHQYREAMSLDKIKPFSFFQFKQRAAPISMECLQKFLAEKGIHSKIEKRGARQAISFKGIPCPVCGNPTANPHARAPFFRLKCFNTNCRAYQGNGGIPLIEWAGISNECSATYVQPAEKLISIAPPESPVPLLVARETLRQEISQPGNSLFLITPGTGKTHEMLTYLAQDYKNKLVLYSCLNRDLKDEAYEKCSRIINDPAKVHLIKARDELCQRKGEIDSAISRGFSPALITCRACSQKPSCGYYAQFQDIKPGLYFVTHHMLQHIGERFQNPDLIVLDENVLQGFLVKESCAPEQMRTLLKALSETDKLLINRLLSLSNRFASQVSADNHYGQILNCRRITDPGLHEDSIIELLARHEMGQEFMVEAQIKSVLATFDQQDQIELFKLGVDIKAVEWLRGLVDECIFSYIEATPDGKVHFMFKKINILRYDGTPVKILDATGSRQIAEKLINRSLREVRVDVQWHSKLTHVLTQTSRNTMAHATNGNLIKLLKEALSKIIGKKVLILTYKTINGRPFASRIKSICEKITLERADNKVYGVHHFGAPRGINDFEDFDSVLCLGLPVPNLNNSWQDALLLFPDKEEESLYESFVELFTNWELIQAIHRIRAVNQPSSEVLIIANEWPKMLPPPHEVIDRSKNNQRMESAMDRILPFVQHFGFLTPDIGYLANVYPASKSNSAEKFRAIFQSLLNLQNLIDDKKVKFLLGETLKGEIFDEMTLTVVFIGDESSLKDQINGMLYYKTNCLTSLTKNKLNKIKKLILTYQFSNNSAKAYNFDIPITLSSTNQWAEILFDLKKKFPHFQDFEIRLPHSGNKKVKGVGNIVQAREFYKNLADIECFGEINLETLKAIDEDKITAIEIPKGILVVLFQGLGRKTAFIGWSDCGELVTFADGVNSEGEFFLELVQSAKVVVTDDGKALVEVLMELGQGEMGIHDVMMVEWALRNGDSAEAVNRKDNLLERYGYETETDMLMTAYQVWQVYERQKASIAELGLEGVVALDKKVLWVIAAMEKTGFAFDKEGAERCLETLEETSRDAIAIRRFLYKTDDENRYRDEIRLMGHIAGRLNSSLHHVPRKGPQRHLFTAAQGCKLLEADYKSQEARVISILANDTASREIFLNGGDIYGETANWISERLGVATHLSRKAGKVIVLGLNNGMSVWGLQDKLEKELGWSIPIEKVEEIVAAYFEKFKGIWLWKLKTIREAKENGFARTHLGRIRWFSEPINENSVVSHIVQGTAAECFKIALCILKESLDGQNARIVHTVHDGILVEVRDNPDVIETVKRVMRETLEGAFEKVFPEMRFPVEIGKARDTWG